MTEHTVTISIKDLAEQLRTIVREELARVTPGQAPVRRDEKRLLSLRGAARRLGTRFTTIGELIEGRKLRTVTIAGRIKVPVSEIERIERDGATQIHSSKRHRISFGSDDAPIGAEEAAKD